MHWQDVVGEYGAKFGAWAVKTLWDPDGNGFPNPDIGRNIAFTLVTFILGWITSLNNSNRRLRARIINELILSQSELYARAYPKHWGQSDRREAWMLAPFVARLRFLLENVNEAKGLKSMERTRIDYYVARVEEFIEKWSETKNRTESYHQCFDVAYIGVRLAVQELGLTEMRRLTGLSSPRESIFESRPLVVDDPLLVMRNMPRELVPAE